MYKLCGQEESSSKVPQTTHFDFSRILDVVLGQSVVKTDGWLRRLILLIAGDLYFHFLRKLVERKALKRICINLSALCKLLFVGICISRLLACESAAKVGAICSHICVLVLVCLCVCV